VSVRTLLQLALAFMRLANWITARIDRDEWQRNGFNQAAVEQVRELQKNLGFADQAVKQAEAATPEQRKDVLEGDL
jgi:hypothetical protein